MIGDMRNRRRIAPKSVRRLDTDKIDKIRGCLNIDTMNLLYSHAMTCPLPRVIEFGTLFGRSTACLAQAMKERNGVVVTLDSFGNNPEENIFNEPNTLTLFWNSMKYMNVERYVIAVRGNYRDTLPTISFVFGMAFIDGGHTREYLMPQMRFSWLNIVPGGYIVIHDYDTPKWPDVTICLNEALKEWGRDIYLSEGHTVVVKR